MVAIVSGNSLGLGQTSLATLGQHGLIGTPQHGRNGQGAFVNVATGNLVVQTQDDHLVAAGADMASVRTYNSRGLANDDNGDNWVMSLGRRPLEIAGTPNAVGSTVTRTGADGAVAVYRFQAVRNAYVTEEGDGAHDTIELADGVYTWTDGSTGATEIYDASPPLRLLQSLDASGEGFSYQYRDDGVLRSVTTSNGERTVYAYAGNLLTEVRTESASGAVTGTRVRYAYDTLQRLAKVTVDLSPADSSVADGKVYVTSYTYDGASRRVAGIAQSDGTALAFEYVQVGADHLVSSIRDALGGLTKFTYLPAAGGQAARTMVQDALNQVTIYEIDGEDRLSQVIAPGGSRTHAFSYDAQGNVATVTDGAGAVTVLTHDARGNRTLEQHADGTVIRRTFNARNLVLTESIGATAPLTTRYVYDATGKLLLFTVSAAGRVTGHVYAGGRRVGSAVYGGKLYTGTDFTEAQLTTWAAAHGAAGVQRTTMAYDARGQLTTRTTDGAVETFVHDQAGRLLHHVAAGGATTRYTYDGLGRVLTATDAGNNTTATLYLDASRKTEVRMANGLLSTLVYDRAGQLVTTLQAAGSSALGSTTYTYDAAGRLRMTKDATGVRAWMLYDTSGRKVADIDGNGTLTQYVYDAAGRLARQRTFATAADTSLLVDASGALTETTLALVRPGNSSADARQWRSYDAAGRLVLQAVAAGNSNEASVTRMEYDAAGRLQRSIAYATCVAVSADADAAVPTPPSSPGDRITRYFHDADGLRTGMLDAEGYLSVTSYNAAGLATEQVTYAQAVDTRLRANGTLAAMTPASRSAADARVLTFYDNKGRAILQVDAENHLTQTVHDAAGNVRQTVRYATKVSAAVTADTPVDQVRPARVTASDRVTDRTYDALGRLATETDAEDVKTTYAYDAAGRLVATERAADTSEHRSIRTRYDVLGRITGELTGEGVALLAGATSAEAIDQVWAAQGITHAYDAASRRVSTTDPLGRKTLYFYDEDGAQTHTVDALGGVRERRYDVQGRVVQEIAYAARISTRGLAGGLNRAQLQPLIDAIANPAKDNRITHSYAASGNETKRTDAMGAVTSYAYNAFGEQVGLSGAVSGRETYTVDRRGLRVRAELAGEELERATSTVYDAFGRAQQTVDANGNVRSYNFDRLGRQVTTTDPLDGERSTTYDAFDRILTETDARGNTTRYAYDKEARSVTVTQPGAGATQRVFNAHGEVLSVKDANGNVTTYSYDRDGQVLTKTVDPTGLKLKTTYSYDAAGQVLAVRSPAGVVTEYAYDAVGRRTQERTDPDGLNLRRSWTYDGNGNAVTRTDSRGLVTRFAYDAAGRLVYTVDPAGNTRMNGYDKAGRVVLTESYAKPIDEPTDLGTAFSVADIKALVTRHATDLVEHRVLDEAGRVLATVAGTGAVVAYAYDRNGNVLKRTAYAEPIKLDAWERGTVPKPSADAAHDALQVTAYDALDRPVFTMDGTGAVVARTYDANGNVLERIAHAQAIPLKTMPSVAGMTAAIAKIDEAERDQRQRFTYDAANRLVYSVDGTGAVTKHSYDTGGNLLRVTSYAERVGSNANPSSVAAGEDDRTTTTAYDAAGRQVLVIDPAGALTETQYDGDGNATSVTAYASLASVSKVAAAASTAALRALVTADSAVDRTVKYAYDTAGRRIYEVDPLGTVTAMQYDGAGNVLARTQHALAIGSGARTASAIANAIETSSADRRQSFGYDAAGRLTSTTDALGNKEVYVLDGVGRKLAFVNKQGERWTYTYDSAGHLLSETTPQIYITTVGYDSDKKILALTTRDREGIVTRMAYDALGNLTQRTEAAGRPEERTTRYEYDAAGRQVRVVFPKVGAYDASEDNLLDNSGVAKRTEDQAQLEARTFYDAFGNAVAGIDVGGGISQKAYDAQGRLVYEVDALGYVTSYKHDAFGQVIRLARHAAAIAIPRTIDAASDAASAAAVANAIKADPSRDRVLLSSYDRAGRLMETQEPTVYVYQHGLDGEGRAAKVAKVVRQIYNAFGELVQVVTPRGVGDASATTTHYYDRAGRQVATVDALGYLTRRTFDSVGNLLSATEHATAVARGWTLTDYGARPAASADDRRTDYTYDRLNRKTAETRVAVQFSVKGDGKASVGDLKTSYAYDAVGNQTTVKDAAGGVTYTYYNALGRVQAVVAPKRGNAAGELVNPLTTFQRDAHGKAVIVTEYASGAAIATVDDYEASTHRDDRKTFFSYDILGRNVVTTDASGHSKYFSYDRHGNLAKQWEAVEGDGTLRTVFQVDVRDKLGRVLQTITPASRWVFGDGKVKSVTQEEAGLVKTTMAYNSFGEMTGKGQGSSTQELFDYDLAGRLWRTKGADGVWRVNLYDLQGNVTSEIRSSGSGGSNEDLSTLADAAAADRLRASRRTDMVYDGLGRVTAREAAARREVQGGVTVDRQDIAADFTSAQWVFGEAAVRWTSDNRVELQWNSLAALGSGDVKVTVEYLTPETITVVDQGEGGAMGSYPVTQGGVARKFTSAAITSLAGATGTTLTWQETAQDQFSGGIGEITRVIVYKKDINGVWRAVVDQAPGYGGNVIDLAAPPNPDSAIALELRKAGTSGDAGWFTVGTLDFGSGLRFDADPLGPGQYEYRVKLRTPGEDWQFTSTGEITLASPTLNTISASLAFGTAGAGLFSWKAPAAGYGQDFRYRAQGSTGIWRSLPIVTNKAGLQVADTGVLAEGAYDFELLWSRTDHGLAVSHSVGSFTVGAQPTGTIAAKPGQSAISTSEGGQIGQDKEKDGYERLLRPLVLQQVDRWGNVVAITDPRAAKWKTTYEYNASNQLVAQVAPDVTGDLGAATTRYYYDAVGRQVAVRDANDYVNGQVWDLGGNLVQELHADGGRVTHRYNAFGNKTSTTDAMGNLVSFTFDDMGRMTSVNKGTARVYRVKGNDKLEDERRAVVEQFAYDELGQRISHTNGDGETLSYSYDLRGNLVQTKQPLGQATRSAFDALGRKLAEVDAEGNFRTWAYYDHGGVKEHRDLGGGVFKYTYDNAVQLVLRSSTNRPQDVGYRYDAAGQVTRIEDTEHNKFSSYVYDLAGRKVREKLIQNRTTYQDNFLSYDAQGRLRDVADGRVHIAMDYDGVGNRTRISTRVNYQGVTKEVTQSSVGYFLYDEMNRQTVVDGLDEKGTIGENQGHELAYDQNGNRTKDVTWRKRVATIENVIEGYDETGTVIYSTKIATFKASVGKSTETYLYDNLNRLTGVTRDGVQIDVRRYDGADRVVRSGPFAVLPGYAAALNAGVDPGEAHSQDVRINRYDDNGRLMHQATFSSDGKQRKTDISWDPTETVPGLETYRADGYDQAGNVRSYVVRSHEGNEVTKYTTTLARFEGYQTASTSAKSSVRDPGQTTHAYDANGFLIGIKDATQSDNNRVLVNDSEGRLLAVKQEGQMRRQLIVNGEVLGSYGIGVDPLEPASGRDNTPNFANFDDFNFGYAQVRATYPAASPGAYQVMSGDTLQSIAQSAYGDSSLWYRIAEANGLSSSTDLRVGQTVNIPNRVSTISNNSTTFKPYDPSAMVGDTTPNMPMPSSGGGCGGVGTVLMLVVAVAVTVYTAGLMAPAAAAGTAGAAGAGAGAAGAAAGTGSLSATMSAGIGALAKGSIGFVGGAIAAGAGSIASQVIGMATGAIDSFSWKGVALSAISGGVSTGVASFATPASLLAEPIVRGAVVNAVAQGIGVVTGLQKQFSWRAVAASGVGAAAGDAVGEAIRSAIGEGLISRFASGFAGGLTTAALGSGRVGVQQVATDAFGTVLGLDLASAASSGGTEVTSTTGDFARMNRVHDAAEVSQNTSQQGFRLEEIAQQNERARADAMYGRNTGIGGLGLSTGLGAGTVGLRYQGARSPMFDDTRIFSDSSDAEALVTSLGRDGRQTSQVAPPTNAFGLEVGSLLGRGYEVVRPDGTGSAPPYDLRDLPRGAPGYNAGSPTPSLGLGAPPKQADDRSWLDFTNPGLPLPIRALGGLLDSLIFKSPSEILGRNLESAGYIRPEGSAPHHIVPYRHLQAQSVRDKLEALGIDLNSAVNGVFLPQLAGSTAPGAYHGGGTLNSNDYFNQLRRDFSRVQTSADALDMLDRIRGELLKGTYPGSKPVPVKK